MKNTKLPYEFDLHCDIKTYKQLQFEWDKATDFIICINRLCKLHDIPLPKRTKTKRGEA